MVMNLASVIPMVHEKSLELTKVGDYVRAREYTKQKCLGEFCILNKPPSHSTYILYTGTPALPYLMVGAALIEGVADGLELGWPLGIDDGPLEGLLLGWPDGDALGSLDGMAVGPLDGTDVGEPLGRPLGIKVGPLEG